MLREVREVEKKHEISESEHVLCQNAFPQDMERRPRGSSVVKELEELFRSGRKESRHPRERSLGSHLDFKRGNESEHVRRKARRRKWVLLLRTGRGESPLTLDRTDSDSELQLLVSCAWNDSCRS